MRSALVFTPVASHPSLQGNSAGVLRFTRLFQEYGYQIHFLYYLQEGLTDNQRKAMSECWDYVHYHPVDWRHRQMSFPEYFGIDDWYEPSIGQRVEELCRIWNFDLVITNYIWQSKLFDHVSPRAYKLIHTHDVFGNRHVKAREAGMDPSWYWTTPEIEGRALDRADGVIAVQEEEAEYFSRITSADVFSIGFLPPRQFFSRVRTGKLRVGYIASENIWNRNSFVLLQEELKKWPDVLDNVEIILAGPICKHVPIMHENVKMMGIVPELVDFYSNVDVCINPAVGGTGLKIKSIEAMAFGLPFVGTLDATAGVAYVEDEHRSPDLATLCGHLRRLVMDESYLLDLRNRSRSVFVTYQAEQRKKFSNLALNIEQWLSSRP